MLRRGLAAAASSLATTRPLASLARWQARTCQTAAGGQQPPQQTAFVPENVLEKVLMAAAEAEGRDNTTKHFHQELMKPDCMIYLIKDGGDLEASTPSVHLRPWRWKDGKEYFPCFTSMQRLQEFATQVNEELRYVALPARVVLEMTKDSPPELMLNPVSAVGKRITKAESKSLLNGTYLANYGDGKQTVKADSMQLGQPTLDHELLAALATSLIEYFKTVDEVQTVHVTQWFNSDESLPHLLIAVDAPQLSSMSIISNGATRATREFLENVVIDFGDAREISGYTGYTIYKKAAQ